ncbi:MAG: L-lactate permease [Microcella sp.]|uniref:L-lactate permease n=1 Tax=Microcella sp. TaxID=1913979 RepID=UPI0024C80047|nr:L-lactate permease [Microcella sp.]UYN82515.1 MAG: L-lactate permease [Microcella sp.]
MFEQDIDPVFGSLVLSAIAAGLPLLLLFVLLGVFKVRAPFAALAALALSITLAIVGWNMPPVQALSAAAAGVFYGFFPILWILVNALWVYRLTVVTPWFEVFGRTIRSVSDDLRVLSILIAFCFGALLESLAGFGAPVAISAAMLLAAGMAPLKAALVSLLANTAPVAFGALAAPVIALAGVTGLPLDEVASMAGRQTPFMALLVPLILVFLVDGLRGLRQTWPVALVAGAVFGLAQYVTSNFFAVELTDVVAAVATIAAVLLMLRVWQPAELVGMSGAVEVGVPAVERPPLREVLMSVAPYLIIMTVFSIAQIVVVKEWFAAASVTFAWPGLDVVTAAGAPAGAQTMHLDTIGATGTLLLISGLLTAALYHIVPRTGLAAYGATLHQLRWTIVTVAAVLGLSFVMNLSGQATSLGVALASAGGFFVVLSPVIGWIGVALTGSDTSSNVLFGPVQVAAAAQVGLPPVLMAAANSSAGVLGKMLSVQNLAVAAAAVGKVGSEPTLLRRLLPWSLGLLALITLLIVLQSTPVLGWMVP